ncbi:protein-L-isoaspartate(D-aspartate) O-methyltransferase [Halocatena halophila]|uniref:protein-L-isoaspartate(D-aspartate) O-methyltransferase n=1 Tax=Halocatena halophila TaxID=2814576 RepID=UPI002ED0819F
MTHDAARNRLVDGLERSGRIESEAVLEALRSVPRHEFVPDDQQEHAYHDRPLPIGHGQTISAPHMVAIMTDALGLAPDDGVLEIGTGCGYHAAVVAELVERPVSSVELIEPLAAAAQQQLDRLGYDVRVKHGDGHDGWPEHEPYDAAYLTCATAEIPEGIIDQVTTGGTIVAPIGSTAQELIIARKRADGTLTRSSDGAVRFVQMQSEEN